MWSSGEVFPAFFFCCLGWLGLLEASTTLLASVANSQQTLTALGTLLILLFSFLGGAWAPSFVLSETLQMVGQFLPTTWATHGLAAVTWRGMGIQEVWTPSRGSDWVRYRFWIGRIFLAGGT